MRIADRSTVYASYHDGLVKLTGAITQSMRITTVDLLRGLPDRQSQRGLDLLAIAASVYALDRAFKRSDMEDDDAGMRTLRLTISVFDAAFWSQDDTINPLTELLCTLTGDNWLLAFESRSRAYPAVTPQHPLAFQGSFSDRVALYSGGLDSAAGLARWLADGLAPPLLLTAGHHSAIRPRVHAQLARLGSMIPSAPPLSHAWFDVRLTRGVATRLRDQEQSQRARAFLFCAAAALVADACNLNEVLLFENGIGAINVPLTEGGLMNAFATRGAHPGTLAKVSALFARVLDRDLRFTLPYVLQTKAEMVAGLASDPQLVTWAQQSHSCVHSSWRVSGRRHCGVCPACLERRQAFRAANADEDLSDYDADVFAGQAPADPAYFYAYLENAHAWTHDRDRMIDRLGRHLTLTGTTDMPLASAEALHLRHAQEVNQVYGGLTLGVPHHRARRSTPQLDLL